jgi:N-dimethylarginine dimethylaminohydrolase
MKSLTGEGDALFFGETLIAGYRYRSDIKAHLDVGRIIDREVLSVELVNPDYYHLDTCFCPLDDTSALYFPKAFDDYGKKVLDRIVPNLVPVSGEDARRFCCNAVVRNRDMILNTCSKTLQKILENLGFTLCLSEFSEFIKAGGSSKCMVLMLHH